MFTEANLRELIDFSPPDPVLSVYLNTNPAEGNIDAYKLNLRNILKEVDLPADEDAVEKYINQEYDWAGRSLAVFSCVPQNFFRAYPLAIPVPSMAAVGDRPSITPLHNLLDSFGGYGVILVDRQGARLFHFHLGELSEQEGVLGESVKHTKRGSASSMPGRRGGAGEVARSVEETVGRNIKESVEFAIQFFEANHIRRVLIGGTDDNIAMFRNHLPKAWQSLVMGTFPISMTASHQEVMEKALEIGQRTQAKREEKLVEDMVTTAAKGGSAVVGINETLHAINDGRVQTLVVANSFHETGFRCHECETLTTTPAHDCEGCEGRIEMIPDVVDVAISTVLRNKGAVEIIDRNEQLASAGNIGAILRY
jgi:peptide subunit release factor 1 (eRF1)